MFILLESIRQVFPGARALIRESSQAYCLTGWRLLRDEPAPYKTNILYVCMLNDFSLDARQVPGIHFLYLVDKQDDWEKLADNLPGGTDALYLDCEDKEVVCAQLQAYFDASYQLAMFSDGLLDILASGGSIQTMVDLAYSSLGNPVVVFDSSYNLIAANWKETRELNLDLDLLENRGFSAKEFAIANHNHIHKRVLKSDVPLLVHHPEIGYDQLLCAINTQKDVGHIVVTAARKPLSPIDEQLLLILKKSIFEKLEKDASNRNMRGFNYESFLRDLLDEKISTSKPFRERLSYVCRDFYGCMYCLVIETTRSAGIVNTHQVQVALETRLPNMKTFMYNGQIIGILIVQDELLVPQEYLDIVTRICKENDLYAGLSNCFDDILEMPLYYKQALRAIELGDRAAGYPNLFLYLDYYLEHINNIFSQKETPAAFCHPKMRFLLQYDAKNDSELAYTLYMYLINERNISSTAAAMHMHRNSVVYRMKKINSLIGDNTGGYFECLYLVLSYEFTRRAG